MTHSGREEVRMSVEELIREAQTLSTEDQARIVGSLLESIHGTSRTIDESWRGTIERRMNELDSGAVRAIPGDEVMARIRRRFGRG
jgi:putative addiction module component (TIGR02574 family)